MFFVRVCGLEFRFSGSGFRVWVFRFSFWDRLGAFRRVSDLVWDLGTVPFRAFYWVAVKELKSTCHN